MDRREAVLFSVDGEVIDCANFMGSYICMSQIISGSMKKIAMFADHERDVFRYRLDAPIGGGFESYELATRRLFLSRLFYYNGSYFRLLKPCH